MDHFGARLKRFRAARSWSQERLGFELNVSKATVSKWESGQALPRLEYLAPMRKLMVEYGLSPDWLTDDGDGPPDDKNSAIESMKDASKHDESRLLKGFRKLSLAKRQALLELIAKD